MVSPLMCSKRSTQGIGDPCRYKALPRAPGNCGRTVIPMHTDYGPGSQTYKLTAQKGLIANAEGPLHTKERREWTKEFKKLLMEYHLRSEPKQGFRKRMLAIWNKRGLFRTTGQQLAGQVRCIKNRR